MTFDYGKVHKKEFIELYLKENFGNDHITSKVGENDVIITVEDIHTTFELPPTSNLDVSIHTFNKKIFWDEIMNEGAPAYVKFSRKKKILLKPIWERAIDIVYKCLESKVASVDDITVEKVILLHVIVHNYKCNSVNYIFECLGMYIFKGQKKDSTILQDNVEYGFIVTHLLRLKGVKLSKGSEINMEAYLFGTLIKGTKKEIAKRAAIAEGSESSNMP